MSESDGVATPEPEGPAVAGPRPALTSRERRRVALWAVAPFFVSLVVLAPFAMLGPATAGDVVGAALVYGGLLGLASGFVAVDRTHARMCPRCGERNPRDRERCASCAYDLAERPRFACEQRHAAYLEPGLCRCGRRLQQLPTVRGVGREVAFILKVGAWLLAFLLGVGLLLQLASG